MGSCAMIYIPRFTGSVVGWGTIEGSIPDEVIHI
jgi:hypothetical protein